MYKYIVKSVGYHEDSGYVIEVQEKELMKVGTIYSVGNMTFKVIKVL